MIFTNPWGLLALLSIPAIVGLHFFRSHRQLRVVGGLHLWQFAAIRQPIGSRWTRLVRSMSLLCQLLAAAVVSLLIAGMEFPRQDLAPHYTILVDDSISMTAAGAGNPVARARRALEEWATTESRFTVVAAGVRPRVLAGPYVERSDMLDRLESWQPGAPSCDLVQAVQFASRFVASEQKMLFLTDQPDQGGEFSSVLETQGLGEPLANHAIVFADRVRITPGRDRVFVTLRTYGVDPAACRVQARVGDQLIYESVPPRQLVPDTPDSFSFDFNLLDAPLEIMLDSDALVADNRVVLAPVPVRNIRVYTELTAPLDRYLARAVAATPFAFMEPDPLHADIVFATLDSFPAPRLTPADSDSTSQQEGGSAALDVPVPPPLLDRFVSASLICVLPAPESGPVAGVAQGLDILVDHDSFVTQGLPLEEGILWPFVATSVPRPFVPLLTTANVPLLFGGPPSAGSVRPREVYYLNILGDRTNLFQTSAWPVLVRNFVEQTRRIVPGMPRTNYRLGEQVHVSLDVGPLRDGGTIRLERDGAPHERLVRGESEALVLDDLAVGLYQLVGGDEQPLATFAVNLFAPAESDLTGADTVQANLAQLDPGSLTREAEDRRLFPLLCLLVIVSTGLSWIFQDSAR